MIRYMILPPDAQMTMVITPEFAAKIQACADKEGLTVLEFVRRILSEAHATDEERGGFILRSDDDGRTWRPVLNQ